MDDLCCAVERSNRTDPGLSIIHPNWRRFTDDPIGVETEIRMGQIYDGSRLETANRFSGGAPSWEGWDAEMWLRWVFLAGEKVAEGGGKSMTVDRIGRVRLLPAPKFRKLLEEAFKDKAFSEVVVVHHHRVYLDDPEAFFIERMIGQPNTLGRWFGYHRLWPHPMMTVELSEARKIARGLKKLILRVHELPKRGLRRDAWRLSEDGTRIVDDKTLTTGAEVSAALHWAQEMVIDLGGSAPPGRGGPPGQGAPLWSGKADRALLAGRFDRLTADEREAIIFDWRMSGDAPEECSFVQRGIELVPA